MRRRPTDPLPFTKPADTKEDRPHLEPYIQLTERVPDALQNQHPIREWEYAMTLRTIEIWRVQDTRMPKPPLQICDVGGANSNFWKLLRLHTSEPIILVDPVVDVPPSPNGDHGFFRCTVEEYAAANTSRQFDVITCISVIEHVPEMIPFFKALHRLLKPGGLLCLTTDYWDAEGPDVAHFHWMRHRIFNYTRMTKLLKELRGLGFVSFGSADWKYPGHQLYDYSVCAVALQKKLEGANGGGNGD